MHPEKSFGAENILTRLKRETEKAHLQLENQIPFENAGFSASDYLDLLTRFYVFYKSLEPQIESAIKAQKLDFDYHERLKTPKLSMDLRHLGIDETRLSNVSGDSDLPALDSAEKVFGALYVVEGSTLGGQIISWKLKEKFGFDQTSGAAFFSGYAAETGKMWNEFRAAILSFAEKSSKHDEIIGAANETFEKFGQALGEK